MKQHIDVDSWTGSASYEEFQYCWWKETMTRCEGSDSYSYRQPPTAIDDRSLPPPG